MAAILPGAPITPPPGWAPANEIMIILMMLMMIMIIIIIINDNNNDNDNDDDKNNNDNDNDNDITSPPRWATATEVIIYRTMMMVRDCGLFCGDIDDTVTRSAK